MTFVKPLRIIGKKVKIAGFHIKPVSNVKIGINSKIAALAYRNMIALREKNHRREPHPRSAHYL